MQREPLCLYSLWRSLHAPFSPPIPAPHASSLSPARHLSLHHPPLRSCFITAAKASTDGLTNAPRRLWLPQDAVRFPAASRLWQPEEQLQVLEPGGYTAFRSNSNGNMLIHLARGRLER